MRLLSFQKEKPSVMSDEDLLSAAIDKPHLFNVLLDRYQKAFLRKAQAIVKSRDVAEDVVQEVFVKIYKHADTFREQHGGSFKSWAYKILVNHCFTYWQKGERERAYIQAVSPELYENIAGETGESAPRTFVCECVESTLSLMPRILSRVLSLYFLEGYSHKEIAKIEHISAGAVRLRMFRAKHLYRKLSRQHYA